MSSKSFVHARPTAGLRALLAPLALVAAGSAASAQMQLVWQDEFDGTALDPTKWEAQQGTGCPSLCGWGNNELQAYRAENAVVGGGVLRIVAKRENYQGRQYTSARIRTRGRADWTYGRFEMRAKLPIGQGIWPAFWMLPTSSPYGTWAAGGEIDIMEALGHQPSIVHGTLHYGAPSPGNTSSGGSYHLPGATFHDDFHVFALEWEEGLMRWYVDGNLYATQSSWWSSGGPYPAPFDQPFHLLLNVAVGGNWPGSPNGQTQFPQELVVDWVRVWQESECDRTFDDLNHADPLGNGWFEFSGPNANGGITAETSDVAPGVGGAAALGVGFGGNAPGYYGGFGRTRPIDVADSTHFAFWIRPDAGQEWTLEVNLQDDDDGDDSVPSVPDGADDEFQAVLEVGGANADVPADGAWHRVVLPIADFVDDGSYHFGGNGVFDPRAVAAGGNGRLANVVFALVSRDGGPITFRTDQWEFLRQDASVTGRLWSDTDGDGFYTGEPVLAGAQVDLLDATGSTVLATTTTGNDGTYAFDGLGAGDVVVRVDPTTLSVVSQPSYDADGTATPHEATVTVGCTGAVAGVDFGYEPAGTATYCTGAPNSQGPGARMQATGTLSLSNNDFGLLAYGTVPHSFGLFFYGTQAVDQPFGEGHLCVGGQLERLMPAVSSDVFGTSSRLVDFSMPPANTLALGTTWYFQYWYRDAAGGPSGFNTSDGLMAVFEP